MIIRESNLPVSIAVSNTLESYGKENIAADVAGMQVRKK